MLEPDNHAPSITLARQAMEIYHQRGEFAMVTFAIVNMRATDEPDRWTSDGYCLLDDGSDILHQDGEYLIGWTDPDDASHYLVRLPSTMPPEGRPSPVNTDPAPVIRWPNRSHVMESLLNTVEAQVCCNPEEAFAIPDADTAYRLAPSLHHAVSVAIAAADTDRYVEKHVDSIARDIADQALGFIQPQDLDAMLEYARSY